MQMPINEGDPSEFSQDCSLHPRTEYLSHYVQKKDLFCVTEKVYTLFKFEEVPISHRNIIENQRKTIFLAIFFIIFAWKNADTDIKIRADIRGCGAPAH